MGFIVCVQGQKEWDSEYQILVKALVEVHFLGETSGTRPRGNGFQAQAGKENTLGKV